MTDKGTRDREGTNYRKRGNEYVEENIEPRDTIAAPAYGAGGVGYVAGAGGVPPTTPTVEDTQYVGGPGGTASVAADDPQTRAPWDATGTRTGGTVAAGGGGDQVMRLIYEGMTVIDASGDDIGKVADFKQGDPQARTTAGQEMNQGNDTFLDNIAEAFGAEDEPKVPGSFRDQLLRLGYVKINASGLFAKDRYASMEQVAGVENDRLVLNVVNDGLITS